MGRRVIQGVQFKAGGAGGTAGVDDYKDRLLKYIPAEVVAVYTTAKGIAESIGAQGAPMAIQWAIFGIILILTPFYIARVTRVPNAPPAVGQIIVSSVAFAVWVFALGGPFTSLPWYQSAYGSLLLVLYTFALPIVFKGESMT